MDICHLWRKKVKLSEDIKKKIEEEYNTFVEHQYAGKDLKERQKLGQFYTPPALTIKMLEKYEDTNGSIIDPTCGAGGLLAAAIIAGFDPKLCYGIELDKEILEKVTIPRLTQLGVPKENLHHGDALNKDCWDFSIKNYKFEDGKVTGDNKTCSFGVKIS